MGANRREMRPPLELVIARNAGGYHVFHNSVKKADGTQLKKALVDGNYDIQIKSNFYQISNFTNVALPTFNRAFQSDLLPSYSYPFPLAVKPSGGRGFALLRGSLHSTDGRGLAGATVNVVGANNPYVTDETGQWVLVFPDAFFGPNQTVSVTVDITPATGPAINVPNVDVSKGTERAFSETAFRGWILNSRGLPIPGATLEVQGRPEQVPAAIDGSWFYYFPPDQVQINVDVIARLPDGSSLTQNNLPVQPRATVIVPTFRFP
jgi:hypothetical protein